MEVRSFVRMNNELPDPESPKLFVGQIPYVWNENDIRMFFDKYGGIYCIDVVRDKTTKQSKGCCFITFFTKAAALEAQSKCHNIVKLQGMNHAVQIRLADKEYVQERRISVEMLSKKLNEADICQMFGRFGLIEDCVLLRDQNGSSRGCAILTFSSKACALNAIKEMHQSTIMDGCPFPLLVKLAEGKTDTNHVSPSVMSAINTDSTGTNNQSPQHQPRSNGSFHSQQTQQQQTQPPPCAPPPQQQQQQHQGLAAPPPTLSNGFNRATPPYPPGLGPIVPGGNILNTMNVIPLPPAVQPNFSYMMQNMNSGPSPPHPGGLVYPLGTPPNCNIRPPNCFGCPPVRSNLPGPGGVPCYSYSSAPGGGGGGSYPCHVSNISNPSGGPNMPLSNSNQKIPIGRHAEGSTLFVYDLPPEYKEVELSEIFSRFGKVISTKVFVDKDTNRSKCFGFVSYDNPISAQGAIQAMNGLQMGSRRLQVRIKKPKDKL